MLPAISEKSQSQPVITHSQPTGRPSTGELSVLEGTAQEPLLRPASSKLDTSPDLTVLNEKLRNVLHQHRQVAQIRDDLLLAKSHVDQERNASEAASFYAEESRHGFMDLLASVMQQQSFEADSERLNTLHKQLQRDSDIHQTQSGKVKAIERAVSNLEYKLANAEQDFANAAENAFALLPVGPDTPHNELEHNSEALNASLRSPLRAATPDTLREYWDALGKLQVLKDDLFEMDTEHRYEMAALERKLEQEQLVEREYEECQRSHEYERQQKNEAIAQAEARAQELRESCISNDIDPDFPRKLPSESSGELVPIPEEEDPFTGLVPVGSPPRTEPIMKSPAEVEQTALLHRTKSSSHLPPDDHDGNMSRVADWLSDPTPPDPVDNDSTEADLTPQVDGSPKRHRRSVISMDSWIARNLFTG